MTAYPPSRAWWVRAGWLTLAAYSVAHFLYSAVYAAWPITGGDMLSAFPGPLTLRAGRVLPWLAKDWVERGIVWNNGPIPLMWNYGPVLHVVTLPFALASTQLQAMRLMLLVDLALLAATFGLWIRLLFPDRQHPAVWLAILCVWLNHFPLLEAVAGREIEIFELFLVTIGVWALRRDREGLAGLAFGLATMTKFLPAVFIPYLFVKGYRRGGYVAVVTVVSIALAAQPLLGWQWSVTMVAARTETGDVFPTAYANQAIANVLYKTFTAFNIDRTHPPTLYPYVLRPIGLAVTAGVLAATAWFIVRWRRQRFLELECALLAIVMCLVPSHANTYYLVFALPALSIGVAALYRRPAEFGVIPRLALAGAIVLMGFLVPMKLLEIVTQVQGMLIARALQGWSLPAYGAVLAAGLAVEAHRMSRTGQPIVPA